LWPGDFWRRDKTLEDIPLVQLKVKPQDYRLLLVDDSKGDRSLASGTLLEAGFVVELAHDGDEGLQMLLNGDYDLALIDHKMTAKTGVEVIREARHAGVQIPLLIITALRSPTIAEASVKAGAQDYIVKPFSKEVLVDTVRFFLSSKTKTVTLEPTLGFYDYGLKQMEEGGWKQIEGHDPNLGILLAKNARTLGATCIITAKERSLVEDQLSHGPAVEIGSFSNLQGAVDSASLLEFLKLNLEELLTTFDYVIIDDLDYLEIHYERDLIEKMFEALLELNWKGRLVSVTPQSWSQTEEENEASPEQLLESELARLLVGSFGSN